MNGLDFSVFILNNLVELSLLSLEKLSSSLFLISLSDQSLRSQLHLGAQASNLFLELQSGSSKPDLHVLNLSFLFANLNLEILPEFIILTQQPINLLPIILIGLPDGIKFQFKGSNLILIIFW